MQQLRVYAAGSSEDRGLIGEWIGRLVRLGIAVTHDWTTCEGYGRTTTPHERAVWAREDLDGVMTADLVWVLAPECKSEGCHVEMGAGLALKKRVLVSGRHARRESRLFALLAEIHDTHAAAFDAIVVAAACPLEVVPCAT